MKEDYFFNSKVIRDLDVFKVEVDLIVSNRMEAALQDVEGKFIRGICLIGIDERIFGIRKRL